MKLSENLNREGKMKPNIRLLTTAGFSGALTKRAGNNQRRSWSYRTIYPGRDFSMLIAIIL
jgi:hypothetical protein